VINGTFRFRSAIAVTALLAAALPGAAQEPNPLPAAPIPQILDAARGVTDGTVHGVLNRLLSPLLQPLEDLRFRLEGRSAECHEYGCQEPAK
jgi:hypothetical protein